MTITHDGDSVTWSPTDIDDTDSPYTTQGESHIYVDTSSAAVTVTLATADAVDGREVRIVDTGGNAATNAITVNTEGAETLNPGGASSFTLDVDGDYVDLFSDGSNWFTDRNRSAETFSTDELGIGDSTKVTAGPVGDEDEYILMSHATPAAYSTTLTSTSYTTVFGGDNAIIYIPDPSELTNIDEIFVRFVARIENDTAGETTTLRNYPNLLENAGQELTHTGTGFSVVRSNPEQVDTNLYDSGQNVYPQAKVTAGQGEVKAPQFFILGRIA